MENKFIPKYKMFNESVKYDMVYTSNDFNLILKGIKKIYKNKKITVTQNNEECLHLEFLQDVISQEKEFGNKKIYATLVVNNNSHDHELYVGLITEDQNKMIGRAYCDAMDLTLFLPTPSGLVELFDKLGDYLYDGMIDDSINEFLVAHSQGEEWAKFWAPRIENNIKLIPKLNHIKNKYLEKILPHLGLQYGFFD